jgi:hypothetical protein
MPVRLALLRDAQHRSAEVQASHLCPGGGQGESDVARAAAQIERSIAWLDPGESHKPLFPGAVQAQALQIVDQIVARRDGGEEVVDLLCPPSARVIKLVRHSSEVLHGALSLATAETEGSGMGAQRDFCQFGPGTSTAREQLPCGPRLDREWSQLAARGKTETAWSDSHVDLLAARCGLGQTAVREETWRDSARKWVKISASLVPKHSGVAGHDIDR